MVIWDGVSTIAILVRRKVMAWWAHRVLSPNPKSWTRASTGRRVSNDEVQFYFYPRNLEFGKLAFIVLYRIVLYCITGLRQKLREFLFLQLRSFFVFLSVRETPIPALFLLVGAFALSLRRLSDGRCFLERLRIHGFWRWQDQQKCCNILVAAAIDCDRGRKIPRWLLFPTNHRRAMDDHLHRRTRTNSEGGSYPCGTSQSSVGVRHGCYSFFALSCNN